MISRRGLFLFLLPWLVSFSLFSAYPIAFSLGVSFTEYNPFSGGMANWVGLANYRTIFGDPLFWRSFVNTITFVVGTVLPTAAISLGLAVLINRTGRLLTWLRTGY
ncbi:MAG TPA: sugar ABC transporter permease, partial [Firmicutes bacterium]|nr:sugar ABC transporter permease [Bacillota bacterium]